MRFGTAVSFKNRLKVLQKESMARGFSKLAPVYLVNEYPKSGGTWTKLMLADALGLPAWTKPDMQWSSCVMQAHWLSPRGNCHTVALLRDGRDVMVSYYFHSFFVNEHDNEQFVKKMRARFGFDDYDDVRANLLPFMEVMHNTPISPGFSWVEFMNVWANRPGTVQCRYEDLRKDTPSTLQKVVSEVSGQTISDQKAEQIADYYSINNMRARQQKGKDENPKEGHVQFIRRGAVGGWTDYFSTEAHDWFMTRAGTQLQKAGYE